MLWVPALFGGLVVLAIGLLTSSVVGPRWGPLGALAAAMSFPVLHAARTTSPDVLVVFVICSGLVPLVAATRAGARGRWQQARAVGYVAGAMVASGSFFRPDALGQTVLLLPVAALLVIRRDGAGAPVLWGAGAATAFAALTGFGLSGGLLQEQQDVLISLGLLAVGLALLASVMVVSARRGARVPDGVRAVLPPVAAALAMIGGLALLALPSRQALVWTSWWTGPYALAITVVVVAVAAHRLTRAWLRASGCLAGQAASRWVLERRFFIGARHPGARRHRGSVGAWWWRCPSFIVCVAAAAAWITRRSTRRLPPSLRRWSVSGPRRC